MKMLLFGFVALVLVGAPSTSSSRGVDSAATATVTIDNFSFQAPTVTVAVGTEVTWVNHDDVPHKVVSTDKKFASPVLDTDGRFTHVFATAGTYEYFCSIHPTMKGKVVVK